MRLKLSRYINFQKRAKGKAKKEITPAQPAPGPAPQQPVEPNQQQPAVDPNAPVPDATAGGTGQGQPNTEVQGQSTEDAGFINNQVNNVTKFFGSYGMSLPVGLAVVGAVVVAIIGVIFMKRRKRPNIMSMASTPPSRPRETGATSFFSKFTSGFGGKKAARESVSSVGSEDLSQTNYESQGPYSEQTDSRYFEDGLTEGYPGSSVPDTSYPASSAQTDSVFIRAP